MYDASAGLTQVVASRVGLTGEAFYTRRHSSGNFSGTDVKTNDTSYGLRFGLTVFIH
jgi:hypothetical protein